MPISEWFPSVLSLAAGVYLALAAFALSRSLSRVTVLFALVMLICAGWSITYRGELDGATVEDKLAWFKAKHVVSSFITSCWFALAHAATGKNPRLSRRAWALLMAMPVSVVFLIATLPHQSQYYSDFHLEEVSGFRMLGATRGPLGWLQFGIAWGLSVASLVVIGRAWRRGEGVVRKQMTLFALAYLVPFSLHVLFAFGLGPVRGLNMTMFSFVFTGVFWVWGMARYGTLNLVPVARQLVLDTLGAHVVVLDPLGRIAEVNRPAAEALGLRLPHAIGERALDVIAPHWRPWFTGLEEASATESERQLEERPDAPWYQRQVVPITNQLGERVGTMVQLRDVTERVRQLKTAVEMARLQQERRHARQLELLLRDLHDGIGGISANIAMMAALGQRASAEEQAGILARIGALASEGNAEVHHLMNTLESRELRWADLVVEFRRAGSTILEDHGVTFSLTVQGELPEPGPALFPGVSLFRIFREALHNVVKHAAAKTVEVTLQFTPACLELVVRDDGRGLPEQPRAGRGMANMRNRARELGGEFRHESRDGLRLTFHLPLPLHTPGEEP